MENSADQDKAKQSADAKNVTRVGAGALYILETLPCQPAKPKLVMQLNGSHCICLHPSIYNEDYLSAWR